MAADHLRQALNNDLRRKIVDEAVQTLKNEKFDTIVCCGISGLLIAPVIADRLHKQLCVVRKQDEICHSFNQVEAIDDITEINYMFVDDLMDCGNTFHHVYDRMNRFSPFANFVGIYLYRQKYPAAVLNEIYASHPHAKVFTANSERYEHE